MSIDFSRLTRSEKEHAELRIQSSRRRQVSVLSGDLVANVSSVSSGACARVYNDGIWGFASESGIHAESAERLLSSARENAELLASRKPKHLGRIDNAVPFTYETPETYRDADQKTLIDFATALDAYIGEKYPSLASRSISARAACIEKTLYTSEGGFTHQLFPRTYIIAAMSSDTPDGSTVELFDVLGGGAGSFDAYYHAPSEFYEQIDSLYEELMKKREGIYAEAGERTCIIDSSICGMVAHEAVGHTVEADLVAAGSVALTNLNNKVASPLINLTDFAHTAFGEKAPLPVYADDEGTEARDVTIIKDGVLVGYMNDLMSAKHFGMSPAGNARAFAYSDEPLIRMRNTCIHPGTDKLADMIASVDNGYYLTRTQNGQADTTGEFMFGITMGYEIKNGRLGRALRDTTISGVAFNMLKTVDMLSDAVAWDFAGYCGKKQPMPVSMGGPAIRCKVNIGGR